VNLGEFTGLAWRYSGDDISMAVTRNTEEMNADEVDYENGRWVNWLKTVSKDGFGISGVET
jgi:hypothetical protein